MLSGGASAFGQSALVLESGVFNQSVSLSAFDRWVLSLVGLGLVVGFLLLAMSSLCCACLVAFQLWAFDRVRDRLSSFVVAGGRRSDVLPNRTVVYVGKS